MTRDYAERTRVEHPAIGLLAWLGWQTIGAFGEFFGEVVDWNTPADNHFLAASRFLVTVEM